METNELEQSLVKKMLALEKTAAGGVTDTDVAVNGLAAAVQHNKRPRSSVRHLFPPTTVELGYHIERYIWEADGSYQLFVED